MIKWQKPSKVETHQTSTDGRFDMIVTDVHDDKRDETTYAVFFNGKDLRGIGTGHCFMEAMKNLFEDLESQKNEFDNAMNAVKEVCSELESNG